MLKIFTYNCPGWGVPCVSPFVSKAVYYLKMADVPFTSERQDLMKLQEDAPFAKLPYIVDTDGTKVADSTEIIKYLKAAYGDPLDGDADEREQAAIHAWNRLIDEHLYWAAVIESRWDDDSNFDIYRPFLVGMEEVPDEVNAILDQFRVMVREEHVGHGLGRMPAEIVYERARQDVEAISAYLGDRPFFMGDKPRSIDAGLTSMLKHIMYVPFKFPTKDLALSKKNLVDYVQRIEAHFGLEELSKAA